MGRYATKSKLFSKFLVSIFLFLLLITSSLAGYYFFTIRNFVNDIKTETKNPLPKTVGNERVNILLLGVDTRKPGEASRSDSIVVVSIDPKTNKVVLMSVLRDTYVKIPGYRKNKINAANALGGPELAIKTISNFIDLPIHYYVQTDFSGFKAIVNAIDGVTVDVPKRIVSHFDGRVVTFNPGIQTIKGQKALDYVRVRKGLNAGDDYARSQRQREVIGLVLQKVKSVYGVYKLPGLLEDVKPYVSTNLSFDEMLRFRTILANIDKNKIVSLQIPANGMYDGGVRISGIGSSIVPNIEKNQRLIKETLGIIPEKEMANKIN